MIETGCDIILRESCRILAGKRAGLLVNPASASRSLQSTIDVLLSCGIRPAAIFGPQHGLCGDTQANMIEWKGYEHPTLGVPVRSLYGERRSPGPGELEGLDCVVIDLPDVGARPYTYLWTSLLMLRACAKTGAELFVLDRPNPLGGAVVEGPMLDERFESFVGLHPLPMRHGLTIGEALAMINQVEGTGCVLSVVRMSGWKRSMLFDETGQPWILPSPNMPTIDTALVYPGTVMLEGTNISEGRGTTRPFEILGAPWIEPDALVSELSSSNLEGVVFRPLLFRPTWDKYADETCGGVQIHVTDRSRFRPVRCGAAIIAAAARLYPGRFRWKSPPYEYEYELPPIDIISGSAALRETIDAGKDPLLLFDAWRDDEALFMKKRKPFLLY
ncbi:MAG: DUF1343 domain-containing protein [Candidatus Krumholzibacteria bacterium]|nr:DUF1343 domain-containing protein [Candidatus Krumholzibacteria bacterium]